MNMAEFNSIKDMNYIQYCYYLQDKYGKAKYDYMTKSFNKNPKCSRTKEGLYVHHMDEDKMIMLSEKKIAEKCPFEWQTKDHLVYCDMLEHLFLHVLICKYPSKYQVPIVEVGIGGVLNFLVPELNDVYSGWKTKQEWRKNCHDKIINDEKVYLAIMKVFVDWYKAIYKKHKDILHTSFNEPFGKWNKSYNYKIFTKLDKLWKSNWLF